MFIALAELHIIYCLRILSWLILNQSFLGSRTDQKRVGLFYSPVEKL